MKHILVQKLLLVALILTTLAACGEKSAQNTIDTNAESIKSAQTPKDIERDVGFESPRMCYQAFQKAWADRDYEKAYACMTPQGQKSVIATYAVMIGLHIGMGTQEMRDSEFGKALDQFLKDRGIDSIGRTLQEMQEKIVPPGESDDPYHVQSLLMVAEKLGDPVKFTTELARLDNNLNNPTEFNLRLEHFELKEINIDGHNAEGWHGPPGLAGSLSFDFKKTDNGWKIDKLFAYPINEPGGNEFREE